MRSLFSSRKESNQDAVDGRQLTLPAELEDGRVPNVLTNFSYLASGLILVSLVWASIAEIREFAVAHGKIIPTGDVRQVHHLEGGQIEKLLVSEGQFVNKGTPMLSLRPQAAESDLGQLNVRRAHLAMKEIRLSALLDGEKPDFSAYSDQYPSLSEKETQVFEKARSQLDNERATLLARITQFESENIAFKRELVGLAEQQKTLQEMLAIREKLLAKGYASRRSYLETKSEFEEAKVRKISLEGRLQATKSKLEEAQSQLGQAESIANHQYSSELSQVAAEKAELDQQLTKHTDRVARLKITAPVSGIIQNLVPTTSGEVVKAGELIAEIVPVDDQVVAEVRIEPRDIGHIEIGHPVEVTLTTYDPNVYGVVDGSIKRLSATTFQTENGEPYYKGFVSFTKNHVQGSGQKHAILPGMVVQANIITGEKSLVRYMLKPVYRSLDAAFTER